MLRATEENLRQESKPSRTVPPLPISTACVEQALQLKTRSTGQSLPTQGGIPKRETCKAIFTQGSSMLFPSLPRTTPMATRRQAGRGRNNVKSSLHLGFGQQKKGRALTWWFSDLFFGQAVLYSSLILVFSPSMKRVKIEDPSLAKR